VSRSERLRARVRDERGFTLIELLTTLSILLIVLGTLTTLMVSATRSEVDLTQRVQAQQEARLALERIRHEIHRACEASGTASSVQLVLPGATGCDGSATTVTWCMDGGGSSWVLRRTATPCTGGRPEAGSITTSSVFALVHPSGSLMKLNVTFPVDVDPADGKRAYRLEDSLVLRNSTRAP
jgi:prepilin-type N-terminal cleavage/methylation domain-containing protein